MKQLRVVALLLTLVSLAFVSTAVAQNFEVPLTLSDGSNSFTMYLGVLTSANTCIDPADGFNGHFEQFLPPAPPGGVFDVRFAAYRSGLAGTCYDQGSPNDFRPFFTSTQRDTFRIRQQLGAGAEMIMTWPAGLSAFFTQMTIDVTPSVNMLTTTSFNLTAAGLEDGALLRIFTVGPQPPPNPGPCLGLSPIPVNFGNVQVGGSVQQTVTATNVGTSNALNITGASSSDPAFTVTSTLPIVVPAGGSAPIVVQFNPLTAGAASANITLTHDALHPDCGGGTSTVFAASGVGVTQGGTLVFSANEISRCDDENGYLETVHLENYAAPDADNHLKALQFRIHMPKDKLNNLGGIMRGSAIPSPAWNFSYIVNQDGGTGEDTARIVIFGNGTNALPPLNPGRHELVKFRYGTANFNGDSVTSIRLEAVIGATRLGTNAQVDAGPNQVINIIDQVAKGDVNNDDVLDILDLLMIVDHILNINLLSPDEFDRANIAPWNAVDTEVNVLDLALLQWIILNGRYPDPVPCDFGPTAPPSRPVAGNISTGLSKLSATTDVKLMLHVTRQGIAVRMENSVPVKGLDFSFGSVPAGAPESFSTLFGGGFAGYDVNDLLRVLMYDAAAGRTITAGERLLANMEFPIANPELITVERFVVAGPANNRLERVEIEIIHAEAPELPTEYSLSQNYPNPFNPTTSVKFTVPAAGDVMIKVYDLLGKEVRTLFSGHADRGTNVITWDGRNNSGMQVTSGTYIYRMTAGSFVQSRKMMFLK